MNKQTFTKKSYKTIIAMAGAAIIAAMPLTARATSYLDISALGNISFDVGTDTFSGLATSWIDETLAPHNISADFSLTYSSSVKYFSIIETGNILFAGNIDSSTVYDDGDGVLGGGDLFEFSFSAASGLLNGNTFWPGMVTIDLGPGNHYGYADIVAATPVPEPATMSLMLIGCSALAAFRRRRTSPLA